MIVGFHVPKPDEVRFRDKERKEEPWLLTPRQCATRMSISRAMLYQLLADPNGLPSIRIGRCRRIRTSDLQRWLDELSA